MNERVHPWRGKAAIFLTSQLLSLFGSSVVGYAVMWYIVIQTSSSSMMALSIICSFVPQIIISPFAGVWADRYNRKIIIMLGDSFTAVATLILALCFFAGIQSMVLIFIISVVRSIGVGLQTPAISAILPQIVPMDKLTKVNGIHSSLSSAMMLVSPAVGGLILSTMGFEYTMLVDVITALLAVGFMVFLKVERQREPKETTVWGEIREGLSYVKSHTLIKNLLIFYALFFFLVSPAAFLTPIMVERTFGADVWLLTANETAWTIGTIAGGIAMTLWGGFKNRLLTLCFSCAAFGITFALMGLIYNFWIYLGILVLSGIFMPIFGTTETVIIQESVEENMLGRVFSIVQIIVSVAMPLGMVLFGPLGDIFEIQHILIITGLCLIVLAPFILKCRGKEAAKTDSA